MSPFSCSFNGVGLDSPSQNISMRAGVALLLYILARSLPAGLELFQIGSSAKGVVFVQKKDQHETARVGVMEACQSLGKLIPGVSLEKQDLVCCKDSAKRFSCLQWDPTISKSAISTLPCEKFNDDYCGEYLPHLPNALHRSFTIRATKTGSLLAHKMFGYQPSSLRQIACFSFPVGLLSINTHSFYCRLHGWYGRAKYFSVFTIWR